MVEVDTRIFGRIAIEEDKVIRFDHGILGFPDLRDFTLIFNEDKGVESSIKWLQSPRACICHAGHEPRPCCGRVQSEFCSRSP